MNLTRRDMIRAIGASICAGMVPTFVPELVGGDVLVTEEYHKLAGEIEITTFSFSEMLRAYYEPAVKEYMASSEFRSRAFFS